MFRKRGGNNRGRFNKKGTALHKKARKLHKAIGKCILTEDKIHTVPRGFFKKQNNYIHYDLLCGDPIPKPACFCSASGDPHFYPYDGPRIDFQGKCKYTFTKSTNKGDRCAFNVELKSDVFGFNRRVSWTRSVDFSMFGHNIRLLQGGKVQVDGKYRTLPVYDLHSDLKIENAGRKKKVIITTTCGVAASWNGRHQISVQVPARFKRAMTGICGNCDGVRESKRGIDRNQVFDNSDRPNAVCNRRLGRDASRCRYKEQANSAEYCGLLVDRNGPFNNCISDPTMMAKAEALKKGCVMDICLTIKKDKKLARQSACEALKGLADECKAAKKAPVNWRRNDFCPFDCPEKSNYKFDMTACQRTCAMPFDTRNAIKCNLPNREGCECEQGHVLHEKQCIPVSDCAKK